MSLFFNRFISATTLKLSVFSMSFPFGLSLFPFGLSLPKPIAPSTGSGRTVFKETLTLAIALLTTGCQPAFIGMDSEADIAAENCYAYRYGDKLRKINFTQAFDWCHRSARFGNSNSQALLGELYYLGLGGEQDIPQAEQWFTSAARQGHAHAQFMLYRIYAVSEDSAQRGQADYWLKQARQSGYKLALQAQ
jgi:TPR repeat protein